MSPTKRKWEVNTMPNDNIDQRLKDLNESRKEIEEQSVELMKLDKLKKSIASLEDEQEKIQEEIIKRESLKDEAQGSPVKLKEIELDIARLEEINRHMEDELNLYRRQLKSLSYIIDSKKNFDKSVLFQNIRELLKSSDVKLGQIEREAGCQPGYMSRLEKDGNTTDPSVEFVVAAAKLLNTSIDLLVKERVSSMTATESYLVSFLEKLIKDTKADKLNWNCETEDELNRMELNNNYSVEHPLFEYYAYTEKPDDEKPYDVRGIIFKSHTFGDHTVINDDCFWVQLPNQTRLYLMNVRRRIRSRKINVESAKEIWMFTPRKGPSFLCSDVYNSAIRMYIQDLYLLITESMKHPKLDKDLQSVIDAYMADEEIEEFKDIDSSGLPF